MRTRLLIPFAFILALGSPLFAQFQFNIDERIEQMKEQLKLTDEQATKLKETYNDFMAQLMDFRNNPDGDLRTRAERLRTEMETKLAEFLTPEQIEQIREMMPGRGRTGGGGGGTRENTEQRDVRRVERAIERMNLTEEEQGIIKGAIEHLLKVRREGQDAARVSREALQAAVDKQAADDELVRLMGEVRTVEETGRTSAHTAEEDLRALLTVHQEAVLIAMGIINPADKAGTRID